MVFKFLTCNNNLQAHQLLLLFTSVKAAIDAIPDESVQEEASDKTNSDKSSSESESSKKDEL